MADGATSTAETAQHAARLLLERAPRHPLHPEYFSSNTLFGQPGIYPGGPDMVPAGGTHLEPAGGRDVLRELLEDRLDESKFGQTLAWFDDPTLNERVPDPLVRSALLLLTGGPAEPILTAFLNGATPVTSFSIGTPDGLGRIIGRAANGHGHGSSGDGDADDGHRVLNQRYAAEHPAVVAPSLAHAICHHGTAAPNAEEATLHGLLGAAHTWLLAHRPELARLGTELSRRQASLTITLLNARAPGSWRASIRCPDGPGTIPGGNPALQCPDLWSIPFTSSPTTDAELTVPEPVRAALARLAGTDAPPPPLTYDDALGAWLTTRSGDGRWFGPPTRARAGRALGLL